MNICSWETIEAVNPTATSMDHIQFGLYCDHDIAEFCVADRGHVGELRSHLFNRGLRSRLKLD